MDQPASRVLAPGLAPAPPRPWPWLGGLGLLCLAMFFDVHRLRLEYAPALFRVGATVSALAWIAWIAAALLLSRRKWSGNHA